MAIKTESQWVEEAQQLFRANKLEQVAAVCPKGLEAYPKAVELWKLWGVALGSLGKGTEARRAFLSALQLDPTDGTTLANFVTSCFHDGDARSAIKAVEAYFHELDEASQGIVLESLNEAIESGLISPRELPGDVVDLLQDDAEATDEKHADERLIEVDSEEAEIYGACLKDVSDEALFVRDQLKKGAISSTTLTQFVRLLDGTAANTWDMVQINPTAKAPTSFQESESKSKTSSSESPAPELLAYYELGPDKNLGVWMNEKGFLLEFQERRGLIPSLQDPKIPHCDWDNLISRLAKSFSRVDNLRSLCAIFHDSSAKREFFEEIKPGRPKITVYPDGGDVPTQILADKGSSLACDRHGRFSRPGHPNAWFQNVAGQSLLRGANELLCSDPFSWEPVTGLALDATGIVIRYLGSPNSAVGFMPFDPLRCEQEAKIVYVDQFEIAEKLRALFQSKLRRGIPIGEPVGEFLFEFEWPSTEKRPPPRNAFFQQLGDAVILWSESDDVNELDPGHGIGILHGESDSLIVVRVQGYGQAMRQWEHIRVRPENSEIWKSRAEAKRILKDAKEFALDFFTHERNPLATRNDLRSRWGC